MYEIINKKKWIPADGMQLEDAGLTALSELGNVLVLAGPGAGKTELLAQKACYLLQTNQCQYPRRILAISFKKDAADNLMERVEKRCGNEMTSRFNSMTYDAFAKRLLDRFINALPKEYQPSTDYGIATQTDINNAFYAAGFVNTHNLRKRDLDKILSDKVNSCTFPLADNENEIIKRTIKILIKGTGESKTAKLSFQLISLLAICILKRNPLLKKSLQITYSHVFLDEFQDTTSIQYELVKTCFHGSRSVITAVGDSKQRIMLWAGALESIFINYKADFSSKEIHLLMNHRSAPRLVQLQKLMYPSLDYSSYNIICSDRWGKEDGEIFLYKFSEVDEEAITVADDIVSKCTHGTECKDICILVKQTPEIYTKEIINKLSERGIRARVENDYQDLIKDGVILLIMNTLYITFLNNQPSRWKSIMEFFNLIYPNSYENQGSEIYVHQKELFELIKQCNIELIACVNQVDLERIILEIIDFYDVEIIKAYFPSYQQGDYLAERIYKFSELLWTEYEVSGNNWVKAFENFEGLRSISIMTIHKSKGLEFDSIYFIGLEDSAFWNFSQQSAEDRCAFFVALSRAKSYVYFTFCRNRQTRFLTCQSHQIINEFFELIEGSGLAEVIEKY